MLRNSCNEFMMARAEAMRLGKWESLGYPVHSFSGLQNTIYVINSKFMTYIIIFLEC